MLPRLRFGMLTPSSNTVLEPVTAELLSDLPEVSAHFARFKVTEIALSDAALGQFDFGPILAAAELLAHAKVDVIAWNGTSASWLGLERDRELCRRIEAATGIRACTAVLAFDEVFRRTGVQSVGLVTPYRDDVQARIASNFAANGYPCTAERHLGIQDNFAFGLVTEAQVEDMCRATAAARPDALAIVCTNVRAAALAARLEPELGLPIYDSVAVTVWKCLGMVGLAPSRLASWGRLFVDPRLQPD
ncbi:MAG: maleate cis-trans isomerase family protein [Hyphomicrobiaceae bacterium]|jgi:maleate isomerase